MKAVTAYEKIIHLELIAAVCKIIERFSDGIEDCAYEDVHEYSSKIPK